VALWALPVPIASKYSSKYGYNLSKNRINSSGEAPSPCFTPILAIYSYIVFRSLSLTTHLLLTYMLRIIYTNLSGNDSSDTNAYHSYSRLIESYALYRSINAMPSARLHFRLCEITVCSINACSNVEWCLRNPAYVGACRSCSSAALVSLVFMTAMNTFGRGGVMAILL
jgi:hypothetical protein